MASVYTTEAAIALVVGSARLIELTDRDKSGAADSGVLDAFIEDAGRYIDARLAQRFGANVPFAQITGTPATPVQIQTLAKHVVLWLLFARDEPDGRDAIHHRDFANGLLLDLAEGRADIPGMARAGAGEGSVICVYEAEDPLFAGLDDEDLARTRGI